MPRTLAIRSSVASAVFIGVTVLARSSGQQTPPTEEQFARFDDRLQTYVELRRAVVAAFGCSFAGTRTDDAGDGNENGETSTPGVTLADGIRRARGTVRIGDIFGSHVSNWVRSRVRSDVLSRSAADRADIFEELPRVRSVSPNDRYPPGGPHATMPAGLLERLPQVPAPLQFRLLGESLVLLDSDADLIVDVVPNVLTGVL